MPIRLSGLATGLDTDALVKGMMQPYVMRVDKMKQNVQTVKWQQEAYRNVINGVNDISKKYFDVLKGDNYLLSSKLFSSLKPTGIPDTSRIKITTGTNAVAGNYTVEVNSLAKKAEVKGENALNIESSNKKMSDIVGGEVEFTINGKVFNYDFTLDTGEHRDKTVSQILSDISSSAKVDFRYSEIENTVILRSKDEGSNAELSASDSQGEFIKTLFGENAFKDNDGNPTSIKGHDAQVTLTTPNGTATITKPNNSFAIDGVNYDITGAKENEKISFTLIGDTEESFNKIKGFIDDYNKLVDDLQNKLLEKKYRDFQPLTEEQKKDMKEEEIKKWEEKSKSGILKSDPNIQNMLYTLRRAFFDTVEGAGISLKEIGLNTSREYNDGGKIVFDPDIDKDGNNGEARLKKLLKEDPDKIYKIFSKQSTSYSTYSPDLTLEQRKIRDREQGILQRVNDIFKDYTRNAKDNGGRRGIFVEKAGIQGTTSEIDNSLYKDLEKREKAIKDMERKLAERESKYYLQFAQLEKYMNQMNSQSAWLAQQLGGGTQG